MQMEPWLADHLNIKSSSLKALFSSLQKVSSCFYAWHNNTALNYPYPNCKYEHKCTICTREAGATDVFHKTISCPRRPDCSPTAPTLLRTPQTYQRGPPNHLICLRTATPDTNYISAFDFIIIITLS